MRFINCLYLFLLFQHLLFITASIDGYNTKIINTPLKFYVLKNGSHVVETNAEITTDYHQAQYNDENEEWLDYSGGDNSTISDIVRDPDFHLLFNMNLDTISDKSEGLKIFNWGHPDYRTDDNCFIMGLHSGAEPETITQLIKSLEIYNGTTTDQLLYSMKGVLTCFPKKILPLTLLQKIPWLTLVERDSIFKGAQIQDEAPWGLSRISNPTLPISGTFGFRYTGKGVDVYIMDSGVYTEHQEFGGRAKIVKSFYPGTSEDCAGHGTETSSVIIGTTVGVAKLANIKAIKVLDCAGNGRNSDLIRGLDFILQDRGGYLENFFSSGEQKQPAVINMSLGGNNRSSALDAAISAVVEHGIPVIVAAGNEDEDACTKSPAGNPHVLTVGATSQDDHRSSYSNYGKCINLFAPGDRIAAASNSGPTQYTTPSGTSLSAPFVTGIVAQLLEQNSNQTVTAIYDQVGHFATAGKLDQDSLGLQSPNILAQALPYDPNDPTQYVSLIPSVSSHAIVQSTIIPAAISSLLCFLL